MPREERKEMPETIKTHLYACPRGHFESKVEEPSSKSIDVILCGRCSFFNSRELLHDPDPCKYPEGLTREEYFRLRKEYVGSGIDNLPNDRGLRRFVRDNYPPKEL